MLYGTDRVLCHAGILAAARVNVGRRRCGPAARRQNGQRAGAGVGRRLATTVAAIPQAAEADEALCARRTRLA
jgi:hypothetical protein